MNTAKRALMTGLVAATLLTTALGLVPHAAYAKPIDDAYALQCQSISRRVAEIAYLYNNNAGISGLHLTDAERDALVAEYRELLRQWTANGCDASFGTLPRLNPSTKIGTVNQTASPGGQVLAPASQP
jgi:hypothetical protein